MSPEARREIEERLAALPEPDLDDPDNPEWTEEDFARAVPAQELPEAVREAIYAAASNTPRPGEGDAARPVMLKLPAEVAEHFHVGEPGWRDRINAALQQLVQASREAV